MKDYLKPEALCEKAELCDLLTVSGGFQLEENPGEGDRVEW